MSHFEINVPDVVGETVDGEVVIINLKDGNYHSLVDVGSAIWGWIEAGHDVDAMNAALSSRFPESASEVSRDMADFLAQLEQESLIRAGTGDLAVQAPDLGILDTLDGYAKPELNSYRDMQDLLLLDPVHEIDETGWPEPTKN